MPITNLGAQLLLELALSKAKKQKQSQIAPIALTSRHGAEDTIGLFQYAKPSAVTWFYLILVEVGSPNTSDWRLALTIRKQKPFEPSKVILVVAVDRKPTEMGFIKKSVAVQEYEWR